MADEEKKDEQDAAAGEEEQDAELLPDREVMSMIAPPGDPTTMPIYPQWPVDPIDPPSGDVATPAEPPSS
jgi:hypothetical protein